MIPRQTLDEAISYSNEIQKNVDDNILEEHLAAGEDIVDFLKTKGIEKKTAGAAAYFGHILIKLPKNGFHVNETLLKMINTGYVDRETTLYGDIKPLKNDFLVKGLQHFHQDYVDLVKTMIFADFSLDAHNSSFNFVDALCNAYENLNVNGRDVADLHEITDALFGRHPECKNVIEKNNDWFSVVHRQYLARKAAGLNVNDQPRAKRSI